MRKRKTNTRLLSITLAIMIFVSSFGFAISAQAEDKGPAQPPEIEKQNITSMVVRATDTAKQNQELGPQGGSGGFPFPVFNNYESQRQYIGDGQWTELTDDTKYQGDFSMYDAIKDDLGIYFKVSGDTSQYPEFADFVRINDPVEGDHNLSLSYFWEWGGGIYLNFPKNTGTQDLIATVKLASISNPSLSVEYKFTIKPAMKLTSISRGSEAPVKEINAFHNAGINFNNMVFNGGSAKYLQVADDIALYVKRKAPFTDYEGNIVNEDDKDWVSIDSNPESGFIYGQEFNHYWNDGGGFYFNIAMNFTFKMQSKSNPNVSVEFEFTYDTPDPNDKVNLTLSYYPGSGPDFKAAENGSIGIITPNIGGRMIDLGEFDYFKKYIWAWDYEVVGSGETAKVVRRDPSVSDNYPDVATVTQRNVKANIGKQYGAWKEIGVDMDSGWRYALAGFKQRDGKQFSLWFDYVYGYWFQPVKYDTQLVFTRPEEDGGFNKTGTPVTNADTLVYNFTGNPDVVIPESLVLENLNDDDWKTEVYWSDEFDGSELDTTVWNYEQGYYLNDDIGTYGWGNNEKEWYKPGDENIYLEDGLLNIVAKIEPRYDFSEYGQPSVPSQVAEYSSGKIHTRDKFSFTYGRIDFKAKAPTGNGLWPALWMMPNDEEYGTWAASGEIDVFEGRGRVPGQSTGALHFGGTWPNNTQIGGEYNYADHKEVENFSAVNDDPDINPTADFDDWHVYSVVWEEDMIKWYVDGKFYNVVTKDEWWSSGDQSSDTAPFDKAFYPIINLALGGWFDNVPVDESKFVDGVTAPLQIDYVRVYKPVGDTTPPVTKPDPEDITLDQSKVELSADMPSVKLNATVTPSNSNQKLTWTTSNDKVAVVSSDGTVNATGEGKCTITATTVNNLTATCEITVVDYVPLESIEFKNSTYNVSYGETLNLLNEIVYNPTDATNKNVEFTVEDESVLTIENGVVKVLTNGTTTVTAKSANGKTDSCEITVSGVPDKPEVVFELSQNILNLTNATPEGKLMALANGEETTDVTWESSNTGVVTVSNGSLVAVSDGNAKITVTYNETGDQAECEVIVTGCSVEEEEPTVTQQENVISQTTDSVTIGVESNTPVGLFITSDMSKDYANVGHACDMPVVNGVAQYTIKFKPVNEGAGFTAEPLKEGDQFKYWFLLNGKVEGPYTYTHEMATQSENKATGISMKPVTEVTMSIGDIYQLAGDIAPLNVTDKEVTWTSNNEKIVTVGGSKGGLLTAKSAGETTVTVKTNDGGFTATCKVIVEEKPAEPVRLVGDVNNKDGVTVFDATMVQKYLAGIIDLSSEDQYYADADANGKVSIIDVTIIQLVVAGVYSHNEDGTINFGDDQQPTEPSEPSGDLKISQDTMILTNSTRTGILKAMQGNITKVVSSNEDVATVTYSGSFVTIKAVSDGKTNVTVYNGSETAVCEVEVRGTQVVVENDPIVQSHIKAQAEDGSSVTLGNGKTGVFFATSDLTRTKPEGDGKPTLAGYTLTGAGYTVKFMPNEQGHLEGGNLQALKKGDEFVYFMLTDGKMEGPFHYINGVSTSDVTGVEIVPVDNLKLDIHGVYQLAADVKPADAGNVKVTWTSSNDKIATVKDGFVTGVSKGTVTITATTEEGKKVSECKVQIGDDIPATGISLNKTSITVPMKLGVPLTATITPSNATNTNIVWESDDTSIAVVKNGVVSGIKEGKTFVTATIEGTDISATCEVTVTKPVGPDEEYPDGSVNTGEDGNAPPVDMDHVKPEVDDNLQSGEDFMYFVLSNNTNGMYSDDEIFVTVLGRMWNENELQPFSYLKPDGSLPFISTRTNDKFIWVYNPWSGLVDIKREYTNLGFTIAELKAMGQVDANGNAYVKVPPIRSGRMYLSYGDDIRIEIKGGDFAGPALENPTDPNHGIMFDFVEFTYNDIGQFWGNTTRVDGYVFPISIRLTGTDDVLDEDGNVVYDDEGNALQQPADKWVGDIGTLEQLYVRWDYETREGTLFEKFNHLLERDKDGKPIRIKAPGKGEFDSEGTGIYTDYYTEYIEYVWDMYTSPFDPNNPMVFTTQAGRFIQTGIASSAPGCNGNYAIKDGSPLMVFKREVWDEASQSWVELYPERRYYIHKPNTGEVFEGKGAFDHHHEQGYMFDNGTEDKMDLVIQSQLCAAFNRGVAHINEDINDIYSTNPNDPEGIYSDGRPVAPWGDVSRYYVVDDVNKGVFNFYAKFWHEFGIKNKAYGFCYDDVWEQATLLYVRHANILAIDFRL